MDMLDLRHVLMQEQDPLAFGKLVLHCALEPATEELNNFPEPEIGNEDKDDIAEGR
ncbi:hypothetical protein FALCPG4_007767 [Fusarium falciforme]